MPIELWILIGPTWRLPIAVECRDGLNYSARLADIPWLKKQKLAVDSVLGQVCLEKNDREWRLVLSALKSVAEPYAGKNAEDVVVWGASIPREAEHEGSEFVKDYVRSKWSVIHNVGLAEVVWGSFCQYALHRLLNERKTVGMWFADLHALRMRGDWPALIPANCTTPSKLARHLISSKMTSWDSRRHLLNWSLAITPSKAFQKSARGVEMALRAREQTETDYVRTAFDYLKAQLPAALEVYAHARAEKIQDHVSVRQERNGCWAIRAHGRAGGKQVVPLDLRAQWSASFTHDSPRAPASLREAMPAVQFNDENVRHAGDDMEEPAHAPGGAVGVLVRHADQGDARSELLVGREGGGHDGLAASPE